MSGWAGWATSCVAFGALVALLGVSAAVTAPRRAGWAQLTLAVGFVVFMAGFAGRFVMAAGWAGAVLLAVVVVGGLVGGALSGLR